MKALLPLLLIFCSITTYSREITMESVAWEPFYSDTLLNNGIVNEIVDTAFKEAGYTTDIQFFSWRRAMQNVKEGNTDVLLGAYYTEERNKIYRYSKPIFDIDIGLIALEELGIVQYDQLEDLKKYTIGVGDDWSYGEEFDSATYLNKDPVISSTQNVRKLFRNRVDMIAMAIPVFKYEYNQIRRNKKNKVVILKPLLASQPIYIMVGRSLPDGEKIIEDFNRGLDIIKKNGTYDHLLKKHGFK
ncbi:transporter substrate-binding domain-containing protein [Vibrio sp. Of7-15]|uniref:substrate-binding periplasmic protein n=1 Tax=Vibrio sp. Of7-15 TaxID=2724879 RepID=UPI001EF2008E|nr:transporter substrate-binding domain-containing protein [Vibrio sp. Of7-15]MCG7495710.1 transporter substrate-binding domain-containing protein [Vibrio sp. Of7-15]